MSLGCNFLCAPSVSASDETVATHKPDHHHILRVPQCSIDFYILWLVGPTGAHKLYTKGSMTCLGRCAEVDAEMSS